MKRKYYKILGIPENASEKEVKKAYRKLALRYHPDVDDTPQANQKFLQVLEAYEIITDQRPLPGKRKTSSTTHQHPRKTQEEVFKERMQRAREQYEKKKKKEAYEQYMYFRKITTGRTFFVFRLFCVFNALIALGFTIDYFAPNYEYTGKVESFHESNLGFYVYDIGDINIEVTAEAAQVIPSDAIINVRYTPVFGIPTHLETVNGIVINDKEYISRRKIGTRSLQQTMYYLFPLTQVIFLFPLYHWFRKRQTIYYTIAHYASIYFLPLFFLLSMLLRYRVF